MSESRSVTLNLRVTPDLHEAIKRRAVDEDVPVARLLSRLVRAGINTKPPVELRPKGRKT